MLDEKTIHERLQKANRKRGYSVNVTYTHCNYWEVKQSNNKLIVVVIEPEGKAKYDR